MFTIAAVTTLSTIVMVGYPLLARLAGFDDLQAGVFFGAAIHDVTQVMGAGALVSPEATTAAIATKLVRVACLAPAVMCIALWSGCEGATNARTRAVPPFLLGFVAFAAAANLGFLPTAVAALLSELATVCLVTATAALGMKTSLGELAGAGWRPLVAVTAQTALIGSYALAAVWLLVGPGR